VTNSYLQAQQGTALLSTLRRASTMGSRQRCGRWGCCCLQWSAADSQTAEILLWWTLMSGSSRTSQMV